MNKDNIHPRRWSGLALFSLLLHLIWLVLAIWILLILYGAPEYAAMVPGNRTDAIKVASEIGRLDLVSLSLAILGVVLAIAAFGGFFLMRSAAIHAAHDEISAQMSKHGQAWIEDSTVSYLNERCADRIAEWMENNPTTVRRVVKLAMSIDDEKIDSIAVIGALDDENCG